MIYIAFNKPFNVLSQFKPLDNKKTLKDFINIKEKPTAVGRIDYDSEGLLLLTDDENFIYQYTSPKLKIEKEYYVQVEGEYDEIKIGRLERKIITETEVYQAAKAKLIKEPDFLWERNPPIRVRKSIPTFWISLTITEGKNRQVRKMTAFVGYPTLRLIRVRVGEFHLENLKPGEFRYLK